MNILEKKIDTLKKVCFGVILKNMTNTDKALCLHKFGFKPKEIAEIIGTNPNNVSVSLHYGKKRNKRLMRNKK